MKNKLVYGLFALLTLAPILVSADIAPLDSYRAFLVALIATLIIELLVASTFLFVAKLPKKKVLLSVALGSLITLPVIWFVFPIGFGGVPTLFSEIFAVIFEAILIYLLNKEILSIKKSFFIALLINLASFFIGFFAMYYITSLDIWQDYFWHKSGPSTYSTRVIPSIEINYSSSNIVHSLRSASSIH